MLCHKYGYSTILAVYLSRRINLLDIHNYHAFFEQTITIQDFNIKEHKVKTRMNIF